MPSSSSAGDAPRRSERVSKRKAVEAASDEQPPKRSRVDALEGSSDNGDSAKGSSESGSQDSGESTTIPSDDGYKDVAQRAQQLKECNAKATLARFKCPVDGCNMVFSGTATTGSAVQHILKVHSKMLYKQN